MSSVVSSIHTTVCTWMDIKYKNEITMNILCHKMYTVLYYISINQPVDFKHKSCFLIG